MTFTVGTISRCSGTTHIEIPVSIEGGPSGVIRTTPDELQGDPPATIEEARERAISRIRSAAKEAGATTWSQLQTAINNQTYKI